MQASLLTLSAAASMGSGSALARLEATSANVQEAQVVRSSAVLTESQVFRHRLTGRTKGASFVRIQMEGSMRISTAGEKALFGEGVYAWAEGQPRVSPYIDIEVPAGTAVETLIVKGQTWYRLLPAQGSVLPVKIVGTDLAPEEIALGRVAVND